MVELKLDVQWEKRSEKESGQARFQEFIRRATVIATLDQKLEAVLKDQANHRGLAPTELTVQFLRERLFAAAATLEPRDAWERELLEAARPCGGGFLMPR